jgi:hypothetical protein
MELKVGCCGLISMSVAIIMAALIIAERNVGEIINMILFTFIPATFLILAVICAVIIVIFIIVCICCD